MKKIVFTLIVFAFLANVSAQIKVNSSGNVGIGKDPQYKLDVAGDIYMGDTAKANIIIPLITPLEIESIQMFDKNR